MEGLHQKYAEIKRADAARNSFVEELLQKITDLHKMMDRSSFVLVLIDGDCMNFRDDLIVRGIEGGDEAAKRLKQAIFDELRYEPDFKHDERILIRVYANLRGLGKAYVDHNILSSTDIFSNFVLGFNKAHPLCDFIDAGNHKEAADNKLRENLNLHIYNVHCTHIIFGASGDNSYASFLNSFDGVDVPSRVRLLKGPPFPFEFNAILPKFKQVVFEDVFRTRAIGSAPKRRAVSQDDNRDRRSEAVGPFKNGSTIASPTPISQQPFTTRAEQNALVVASHEGKISGPTTSERQLQLPISGTSSSQQSRNVSITRQTPTPTLATISHTPTEIEVSLILATNERLTQNPKALDFGDVKQRVVQLLRLPSNFWTDVADDRMKDKGKDAIKWAIEDWIERTNSPPPKNATWLLRFFPEGVAPHAVLRSPSSLQWRTKGNPEWTGLIGPLIAKVTNSIQTQENIEA